MALSSFRHPGPAFLDRPSFGVYHNLDISNRWRPSDTAFRDCCSDSSSSELRLPSSKLLPVVVMMLADS